MSYLSLTEQQVLTYFYKYPEDIDSTLEFISEQGKAIYKSIIKVVSQKNEITPDLIYRYALQEYPKLKEDELGFFNTYEINKNNAYQYIKDLRKLVVQENIQNGSLKDFTIAIAKKQIDENELFRVYEEIGGDLKNIRGKKDTRNIWNEINEYEYYLKILSERLSGKKYYSGCSYLDQYLYNSSLYPGEISILFADTSMGKSSYMNYLVEMRRIKCLPTLHIQLEMSESATLDSKMALRLNMDKNVFQLNDEEIKEQNYQLLKSKIEKRYPRARRNNKYFSCIASNMNFFDLQKLILDVKKKMGISENDYLWIGIDLLTMIDDFNRGNGGKASIYEDAMNTLNIMAKDLNVHFMGVVQKRRVQHEVSIKEVEDVYNFRPTIEAIKNAHAISERARVVIGVFRPIHLVKQYLPDDPELEIMDDIMEVQLIKSTMSGVSPIFKYLFNPNSGMLYRYQEEGDVYDSEQ